MAILNAHLLSDLDMSSFPGSDWSDLSDDLVLGGCLWCTTGRYGDCTHAIGGVEFGEVTLKGLPGNAGGRLEALLERVARSIVQGGPLPVECRDLPDADRLVAAAESAWKPLRDAARHDPDVESWSRILQDRLAETFSAWCFALLCSLSGGTLHRLDESDGSERWIAMEPALLGGALEACLRGDRDGWSMAGDPLCRATSSVMAHGRVA
jgi:hypothetical protein